MPDTILGAEDEVVKRKITCLHRTYFLVGRDWQQTHKQTHSIYQDHQGLVCKGSNGKCFRLWRPCVSVKITHLCHCNEKPVIGNILKKNGHSYVPWKLHIQKQVGAKFSLLAIVCAFLLYITLISIMEKCGGSKMYRSSSKGEKGPHSWNIWA